MSNVPNLDDIPPEEAQAFFDRASRGIIPVARELFPKRPLGYVRVAKDLKWYAFHRARAGKFRLAGDIHSGRTHELEMQRIYDQLPKWARW
jgi:hypothetical protein